MRKEEADFFRSLGLCPRCGKNKLFGSEKACPECRAESTNYASARREKDRNAYNSYQRQYMKNHIEDLKSKGLCCRCGKRKATFGFRCSYCYSRDTETRRVRKNMTKVIKPIGTCRFCNNPVEDGYKVCEYHHQMNIQKARSQKSNIARKELLQKQIIF